jgi:hypothetical protein
MKSFLQIASVLEFHLLKYIVPYQRIEVSPEMVITLKIPKPLTYDLLTEISGLKRKTLQDGDKNDQLNQNPYPDDTSLTGSFTEQQNANILAENVLPFDPFKDRYSGRYSCPYGVYCRRGGVNVDGTVKLFTKLSEHKYLRDLHISMQICCRKQFSSTNKSSNVENIL